MLALPTLLLAMDVTVLYLAVPRLAADLRPSGEQMLWITDIYGFMIAGFLVTMGTLGDRIGRRRLLMWGAGAFGLASVAAAYAPSAEALIAARALLGIAGATLMPSTLALISNMFRDARQRGAAIGIWAASMSGGVALGPVVGGAMLESFGWGAAFLIAVPVMALLLAGGPLLLPEYRDATAGRPDLVSVALSLVAMLTIVYGVKLLSHGGDPIVSGGIVLAGLAAAVVFWRRQRGLAAPVLDVTLVRNRALTGALLILLLGLAATAGTYLFVTRFLQGVEGLSPLTAGLWLVPSSVAMILTSLAAPILVRRLPERVVVAGSLAVSAAGFLLLALLDQAAGLPLLIAGIVVVYLGQGPIMALGTDLVVGSAPPEKAGSAAALSETSTELGLALGVAVLGSAGAAVYRQAVPAGLPPEVASSVRDSIEAAVTAVAHLPPARAEAVIAPAREAFTAGLNLVAGIGAVVALALAVLALVTLRRAEPAPPEPATSSMD
ncbi:MFS transporter, DHA2 family, multidrug resistance protein [Nonomuraea solani]|uniref:MFS transporter, DHA2 family, multidrug resistance protein n=2 Tax=Nonomuraea solani TaxID=1144553 RepID=A0A1H6EZ13_9ACTN|nr:MFS transporter, DHA2 family, multidrug resistance protein [Nonomuraea solani]